MITSVSRKTSSDDPSLALFMKVSWYSDPYGRKCVNAGIRMYENYISATIYIIIMQKVLKDTHLIQFSFCTYHK